MNTQSLTLKETIATVRWTLKITFKISRLNGVLLILTRIILDLESFFNIIILGGIIDFLINSSNIANQNLESLIPIVIIIPLYGFIFNILGNINSYSSSTIYEKVGWILPELIFSKLDKFGIKALEDPERLNQIQRSRESISRVIDYTERSVNFVSQIVRLIIFGITSFAISPLISLLMIIFVLPPNFLIDLFYIKKIWHFSIGATEEKRRVGWASNALSDSTFLHEIKIIGAFNYLKDIYKNFYTGYISKLQKYRKRWYVLGIIADTAADILLVIGVLEIFKSVIEKTLSIGQSLTFIRAISGFKDQIGNIGSRFANLQESGLRVKDLKDLLTEEVNESDGNIILPYSNIPPTIELRDLSFTYPNSSKEVLSKINLKINPGEKIAIVGENGAGKTTLLKLISRIYTATQGNVLINKIDINKLKIESWYKLLGFLFQDFNRYGFLTAEENIFIGDLDKKAKEENITETAKKAQADEFINKYDYKYKQILSEKFKNGTRPSHGQWQKIGIARFFYRESPVVILDEPTSAIDAISENKIFNNIFENLNSKTVIIVSHKFSTVRQADRIIVLDKGEIKEEGNHKALMELKGLYYKSFTTQASGYK